jgi:2-oxoglutarate dehydrogenase E1 component
VSELADFGPGTRFKRVYGEQFAEVEGLVADAAMRKVVFCSGKLFYELLNKRREGAVKDVAIVRIEQLAPFPFDVVAKTVAKYPAAEVVWAQEEPKNMGPWYYVQERIVTATRDLNGAPKQATYIGRKTMASPADGYADVHLREQNRIVEAAIN